MRKVQVSLTYLATLDVPEHWTDEELRVKLDCYECPSTIDTEYGTFGLNDIEIG